MALATEEAREGFKSHATLFVVVLISLAALNYALHYLIGVHYWVQWVFLAWGLGLLLHAWLVFFRKKADTPRS